MRLRLNFKYALVAIALACLAAGLWQAFLVPKQELRLIRVISAARSLPAGVTISAPELTWVEVPEGLAGAYLTKVPADAVLLRPVALGELVPAAALGFGQAQRPQVVSVQPLVVPVRSLQVGDFVDVWAAPGSLVAVAAQVTAVSAANQSLGSVPQRIDLAVAPEQMDALLKVALADQPRLALVRSRTQAERGGSDNG